MNVRRHLLTTAAGRRLEVVEAGDSRGLPIFVHHGTPACADLAPQWIADGADRGLRVVAHSRPGYAGSDRLPGRDVAQVADDVSEIADQLGIGRFATWGLSGGGPHALACAALLPERVVAAASISGAAPFGAEGLEWLAGMGEANVAEFEVAISQDEARLLELASQMAQELAAASPQALQASLASLLSPEDAAIVSGPFGEYMARSIARALAPGGAGSAADDLAVTRSWGFDVAAIRTPVQVWQGGQDLMVPAAHGGWLAERIPGAEAHLEPGIGHLTIAATRIGEVHGWLARHF